jgi:LemA protein
MIIGLMFIGAVILIGVFLLIFVIGGYNALVTSRNRYKNAYSQIDVQLKRRYDLIPNLVETAKGYLQHERGTLEAVITAGMLPSRPIRAPRKIRATLPL